MKRTSQFTRKRAGNAMLEFALGSSVLISLFAGTFQFGYAFYVYNNLTNAVSRGARYASLVPYDSASTTPSNSFKTAVQNMVVYGSPAAGTTPVVPGLTTSNVNLTVTFTNGIPASMTVDVSGYSINAVFQTFTLTNKPSITFIYQGIWTPV